MLRHLVAMSRDGHDLDGALRLLTDFDLLAAEAAARLLPDLLEEHDAVNGLADAETRRDLKRVRRALELGRFLLEDDPDQSARADCSAGSSARGRRV